MFLYPWIVLLHVLSVAAFLMAHGVAMFASFQLRQEKQVERVKALIELSAGTYGLLYPALVLILLTGITLAFMGGWWGRGWIWLALALFVVEVAAMSMVVARDYTPLRKALGIRYFENGRPHPPVAPAPEAEVFALLERTRPGLLAAIGGIGLILIFWLMLLKPF